MEKIRIYGAGITFQYSNDGEIDNSHGGGFDIELSPFEIDEDGRNIPAIWQKKFASRWEDFSERKSIDVLSRLRELISKSLEQLPDNPFVIEKAWLLGVNVDKNEANANMLGKGRKQIAARAARMRADIAEEKMIEEERLKENTRLNSLISCINHEVKEIQDEGGMTHLHRYTLKHNNGETLKFSVRNIFDFGVVINPDYEVIPGMKGGLAADHNNALTWHDFRSGEGWVPVRELTEAERDMLRWLSIQRQDSIRM